MLRLVYTSLYTRLASLPYGKYIQSVYTNGALYHFLQRPDRARAAPRRALQWHNKPQVVCPRALTEGVRDMSNPWQTPCRVIWNWEPG
jgi:hypothetical protein